ncbi:MAG TPA: lysophospholipid acyltransferase family protein [Pilimelia sp.]|nr:lysophospholipid acyltransferase family protein [Pilimelia sp.]
MELVYRPLAATIKAAVRVMGWRILVAGGDVIPHSGAAVIACNHVSYLDPVMLGLATDRRGRLPRFLAKRELFAMPVFGAMLREMRHVPVDRRGAAAQSLPEGVARLREGHLVAVFPEATIRTEFDPANGKTGAARLAVEAGVPLIPMGVWGGQAIATKGEKIQLRRRVPLAIHVGEPLWPAPGEDAQALTWRLMVRIGELAKSAREAVEGRTGSATP